ncbi:MAG: SHOCT domain-containing protein [Phycisphaerae bacterium]|nr:SHOCT domain-containing protein [Phycisphaerae bacterium]
MASATADLVLWTIILALFVVVAVVGLALARRIQQWARADQVAEPFTLQDLREMRERGEISEIEFEAMRAGLIGRILAPATPRESRDDPFDDAGPRTEQD